MAPELERITPYVTRQWLHEQRMVIFGIEGARRSDLDEFTTAVVTVATTWDKTKPFLVMYDLSGVAMTPYARERATYIGEQIPLGLRGRTAILLPNGLLFRMFSGFIKHAIPLQNVGMRRDFFVNKPKALAWLEEGLED